MNNCGPPVKDSSESEACTTNAHDLAEAAKLKTRLESQQQQQPSATVSTNEVIANAIPSVYIDEGANKYVLITANTPNSTKQTFVYSKRGASYHRNVAEFLIPQLEGAGYYNIRVLGGGRILRDDEDKLINIFGFSYGFGRGDHELALEVVQTSGKFDGYKLDWSNEGY